MLVVMTKTQLEASAAVTTAVRTHPVVVMFALLAPVPVLTGQLTSTALDPMSSTISQYVYLPGGYPMVLLGALLLAGCALMISLDLARRPRVAVGGAVRHRNAAIVLLVSYAAALTVVGLVPTDPPGSTSVSVPEIVHRVGVSWAFLSLPIAGLVLARAPRLLGAVSSVVLSRFAAAMLGGVLLFGAVQLPLLTVGASIPGLGLVERIAFVFMIGYLIMLAVTLGFRVRPRQ
jgi:hypothetical protein